MRYTLDAALASISEYRWTGPAHLAAVWRLTQISESEPCRLKAESARIRQAFYAYADGYNYGRP
jgi:hypothetical protein